MTPSEIDRTIGFRWPRIPVAVSASWCADLGNLQPEGIRPVLAFAADRKRKLSSASPSSASFPAHPQDRCCPVQGEVIKVCPLNRIPETARLKMCTNVHTL